MIDQSTCPHHPQSSHSPAQRGPVLRSDSRKDLAGDRRNTLFTKPGLGWTHNIDRLSPFPLPRPLPRPRPAFGQFLIQWPVRPQPKHSLLLIASDCTLQLRAKEPSWIKNIQIHGNKLLYGVYKEFRTWRYSRSLTPLCQIF